MEFGVDETSTGKFGEPEMTCICRKEKERKCVLEKHKGDLVMGGSNILILQNNFKLTFQQPFQYLVVYNNFNR